MKDAFIAELLETQPSLFVSKWILERTPHIFGAGGQLDYVQWKMTLSEKIGVDPCAIAIAGTAGVGVSMNPEKSFRGFDAGNKPSDIDVALVSGYHFEISWRYLRNLGSARYRFGKKAMASFDDHKSRLIYDGTIATDKILEFLPFGAEWAEALSHMSTIPPTVDRDIKVRIYRDFDCLRGYHVRNVKFLKNRIIESRGGEMNQMSFLDSTHRNIIWFKRVMEADELQMKPPYQRNPVWTENQKSYLIDTILRSFPIPEIYMQDIVTADGLQTYVVVDGQQRIRACLEFLEGEFPLDPEKSADFGDCTFEELKPEDRQKIYSYKFVIRLLPDAPEPVLREIFQRLNKNNVALNAQELRQATYWGPFIQTMNRLSDDAYWAGTGIFTPNDVRRMLDVEYISELAVALLHGPQNKKQSLDRWYTVYEKEFEQRTFVESTFARVLGELNQLLPHIRETRWRKKSDFYTLFLVMANHADELPLSSDQRREVVDRLTTFQSLVNQCLKEMTPAVFDLDLLAFGEESTTERETGADEVTSPEGGEDVAGLEEKPRIWPIEVAQFAAAVQRAASDLANRRSRASSLERYLQDVWLKVPPRTHS